MSSTHNTIITFLQFFVFDIFYFFIKISIKLKEDNNGIWDGLKELIIK